MSWLLQYILWIDCLGALAAGVFLIAASGILSRWENLPQSIVIGLGVCNLLYGTYSLFVTTRNPRPLVALTVLAFANIGWLAVCITLTAYFWPVISLLGVLHLLGEGFYVAALGVTEWRLRHELCQRDSDSSNL